MPRHRDRSLDRFLLPGERVVIDVRQHWGVVAGPVAIVVAGLFVVLWTDAHVRLDGGPIARGLWIMWFGSVGWMVFQLLQWRHDRFIATDKRLLLDYGLVTQKVAMMPLIKVIDMSYRRSVPGRIFGYGQFILESAGQDQALRQIDWVPDPNHTYRVICAEIFGYVDNQSDDEDDTGRPDREDRSGSGSGSGSGDGDGDGAGPPRVPSPLGRSRNSGGVPSAVDERWSFSQAIPLHRRGQSSAIPSGEVIYSSDEARLRRRMADTGPIPLPPQSDD